ncbi:MAG: rhodanese-like domain-containing protein [Xanthobacteraceae bacterium]
MSEAALVAGQSAPVASQAAASQAAASANPSAAPRAPYPGLRSFRHDESDLFFGREEFVTSMVDRLATTRFLAVLGSSGTGKSSVVRTGLLDSLELGLMAKAGSSWRVADFRPGSEPLHNLADALLAGDAKVTSGERQLLRGFLARGPRAVIEWCRDGNLPAGTNLLLLADQFEELFRYQDYAKREETQALVELLLESAHSSEFPVYVTITMRSEYLGACAFLDGLAEAISRGMVLIPRLTREQCRTAIIGPAEVCGIKTDPPLVNRLLNDLASFASWDDSGGADELDKQARRADQLPLLQYTLNRMWLRARERLGGSADGRPLVLRLADYETIGGLRGALNAHADQLLEDLKKAGCDGVVEPVFRALVSGTTVAEAVRRPRKFGELVALAGGDEQAVRKVVDAFRGPGVNFLTPERGPLNSDTDIDISHESLIRQWGKLSGWLQQEARDAQNLRRLQERTGYGDLLQGRELAQLVAWREEAKPTAVWAKRYGGDFAGAIRFLDLSQRAEQDRIEAAVRAEQDRLAAKQRAEQERRRRLIMGAAAVVAALGGFSVYALIETNQLQKQKAELQAALAREAVATKTAEEEKARAQKAEAAAKQALADKEAAEREAATIRAEAQHNIAEAAKGLGTRPTAASYADESKDFGVAAPTAPVKTVTGPTPSKLPGGRVLTTAQLWDAIVKKNLGPAMFLVDVSAASHAQSIPGAQLLPAAGQGAMDKTTLNQVWTALSKLTGGNFNTAIVFFGTDVKDWSPYNAALHAINFGYSKVYWYRGGITAWKAAGQPLK